jgi:hypothetical protein
MTASYTKLFRVLVLPVFLFLACVAAHGQQNSALSGTITDKSGAAVAGAHVVLKNPATGTVLTTDTNDSGTYNFPALDIGTYDLTVTAKGFETEVQQGLQINISQSLQSNLTLSVGAVDQTVTVEANALAIQTDTNVLSTLVSSEQISEIATENRNVTALVALGLGVSSLLPSSNTPTSVGSSASISVNGLRQSHNIWLIDGGEADDRGGAGGISIMPSQDSIAQIETLASNYPPDYGISSGATISLAIKSGTRHFHGEAWEFNRNTVFDANNYLTKQSGGPRATLNYNIFGANVSGPLFIPHLYNNSREKTFFFWNEEWRHLKQGSSANVQNTIPTADFPTAGQPLTYFAPQFAANPGILVPTVGDPAYNAKLTALGLTPGQPFPNNVIPAALIDPNAVQFLSTGVIPKPNLPNGQNSESVSLPITVRDDVVRIDHNINDKWHILGHYIHDSVTQAESSPVAGWSGASYNTVISTFSNPSNSGAIKVAGTISPSLLVEASLLYDGNIINIVSSPNGNLPSSFAETKNKYFNNDPNSLPTVIFGGPYNTGEKFGSGPWHNAANDYAPKVDVSYTLGKHALKFGLGYNRYEKNQKLFLDSEGDFTFGGGSPVTSGVVGTTTFGGDSAVDFLLGLASNYSESQAAPIRHYVNQTVSAYGYDTWQVTKNLSLQIGLRYDALPHAWEKNNQIANFNPNAYLTGAAPVWNADGTLDSTGPGFSTPAGATQPFYLNGTELAGVNGTPIGLVNNDYKTLQPRVGFSQKLDNKTVLRGGFGTFYERLQGNDIYNAATSAPFANTPQATKVYLSNPHTSWVTGDTAALPFYAQGLTSLAQDYRAPAAAQFSLGVQREIAPSVVGVAQYVGNLAWHQNIDRQINNYSLNTPLQVNTDQSLGCGYQYYSRANIGDPHNLSKTNMNVVPTGAPCGVSNPNQLRNFPGYGGITQQENTTNGGYNGLQFGLRSAGYHGLSGEFDYTYSHEIDITSTDLSGVSNPYNLKQDKGSGTYDRRNIFSANYVYKLPLFAKSQGLVHSLLGGWEVAGTFVDESGTPFTPGLTLSYDPVGLGGGYTVRPDVTGKVTYSKSRTNWFNSSQFSTPVAAWAGAINQGFGDAGKDAIVGPGRVNFDTSVYKSFAITEHDSFQFRAESFNTFNHAEFNGVDTGIGDGNTGRLNSVYDPRTLEIAGKLIF